MEKPNRKSSQPRSKVQKADPPEFASYESYGRFAHTVRHSTRYVHDGEIKSFLSTVLATARTRAIKISKDTLLFRAQAGVEYLKASSPDDAPCTLVGLSAKRMKPVPELVTEGRVNPAGICVLYLASSVQTAISETRPWVGSDVTVCQFRILRDLRAVDLSRGHGQFSLGHLSFDQLTGEAPVNREAKEQAVWIDLDNAFSQPVTRDTGTTEYVPTQILAEVFRDAGYEALVYRSQFGKKGYNLALFDLNAADAINGQPYRVDRIAVTASEMGGAWHRSD